jgi:hypothetical protein
MEERTFGYPMLRPGLLCVEVEKGSYVERGTSSFLVKGRRLHPVVSRLLRALDGRRTLGELEAALPDKLQPLFETLLQQLQVHDMVMEGPAEPEAGDHPNGSTLSFLQERSSRWREAFSDWSRLPITVGGSPALVPPLARSLTASGAGNLRILAGSAGPGDKGVAASAIAEGAYDAGALLVYLTEGLPIGEEAVLLERLAARHGTCLFGGIHEGIGVIGPESAEGPHAGLEAMGRIAPGGLPFTAAARAVLSSLAAFEALNARLAPWSDSPGETELRRSRLRIVRADGSVSLHDSRVALSGGRPIAAMPEPVAELPPPQDPAFAPWFDASFGLFAWAEVDGPEYPLPHRAVALRSSLGADATICDWGVDPDSAEERTLLLAVAAFESGRIGHQAGPGVSPLIAARSEAELSAAANALAQALSPSFLAQFPRRPVAPKDLDDPDGLMLARLAHRFEGSVPALWLAGSESAQAFLAWAMVGPWTGAAAAPSASRALTEAIGNALSALQRGAPAFRQAMAKLPPSAEAGSSASHPRKRFRLHFVEAPHLPTGIFLGYAKAEAP